MTRALEKCCESATFVAGFVLRGVRLVDFAAIAAIIPVNGLLS
jgi:hypothetical protein